MNRFYLKIEDDSIKVYTISDDYLNKCKNDEVVNSRKKDINKYLESSDFLSVRMSQTKCIFCSSLIMNTATLMTDGKWIWSGDLNHYSELHNFQWPDEFIDQMAEVKFNSLKLDDDRLMQLGIDILSTTIESFDGNDNFNFNKSLKDKYRIEYFDL